MLTSTYKIDLCKTLSSKGGWAYSRGGPNVEVTQYKRILKYTYTNHDIVEYNTILINCVFQLTGFLQAAKNSVSEIGSFKYDRMILALSPFGGSLVILTPF